MAVIGLLGFETGGALSEVSDSVDASVESTIVRTGDYALKLYGTTPYAEVIFTASGEVFWRTPFRFTQTGSWYLEILDGAGGTVLAQYGVGAGKLRVQAIGGTQVSGDTTVSVDQYYMIEIRYKKGTGSNAIAEIKLDGSVEATSDDGTATADAVALRCISPSSFNTYFDDFIGDDDAYPGAGQIEALRPNAVGDGDTNYSGTWDDINDDPINEATYRECTAATGTFDDAIDDTDTLTDSLGGINHVRVGVWTKGDGASNDQYIHYKNNGAGIQESGNLLVDKVFEYHTYDPGTQPTTAADIDGAQMGMRHDDSKDGTVAEMWLMVDYDPDYVPPSAVIRDVIGCGVVPFAR